MFKNLLIALFGMNYETSISGIITVIGIIPSGIQYLGLDTTPDWLKITGAVCSFISFIYMSYKTKSTNVTGTGNDARRKEM